MKKFQIDFQMMQPFRLVGYYATNSQSPDILEHSHIHRECEIYVNLSGDISFMVEDRIYPVTRGSAIITRPYEYHHCIYNSQADHEHFWLLFTADGNEAFLKGFFQRPLASNNLIVLPPSERESLIDLCFEMMTPSDSEAENYARFFKLVSLLEMGQHQPEEYTNLLPRDVGAALHYIKAHLSEKIVVDALAGLSHVSVSTLERHFREALQMTPIEYMRQKRLACAARFLKKKMSVGEACERSGFTDYSHFIKLFKDEFGMTPLQYKKMK